MAEKDFILIKGAREHNLKNLTVKIPRNKLTIITGLSGSGKSSLAFDTIYAEGQRRYVESLSAYARQFLEIMEKPDIDYIEGLSPAISIEQKTTSKNPRSTVGTVTEIYDYLRLLFARIGIPYCYKCGKKIEKQTVQQIVDIIMKLPENTRIQVLGPLIRGRKGEYRELFKKIRKEGFVRIRVDGETHTLDEEIKLDKNKKHDIEVVVDRLIIEEGIKKRLTDSLEIALQLGSGIIMVDIINGEKLVFSENFACIECGISYEELEPRMFSFNTPYGACPQCSGLGTELKIDPDLVIPDKNLSISQGAIASWASVSGAWFSHILSTVSNHYNFSLDVPFRELSDKAQSIIFEGTGKEELKFRYEPKNGKGLWEHYGPFEGVIKNLERRFHQTKSAGIRDWIQGFMTNISCSACGGSRLRRESLAVRIMDKNIIDITKLSIRKTAAFFKDIKLSPKNRQISRQILKEINERLQFLISVGLDYLNLNRSAGTLSGGEAQRIRLATQIGSQLVGVLYILDEPSIGLHQRDNLRLINTLEKLRDLGNTVIVVEHDKETMEKADWLIDLGPGAGKMGGRIVIDGPPDIVKNCDDSITGQYLSGKKKISLPSKRKNGNGKALILKGAGGNNLKAIDVEFPLGTFIAVTGVSGSGKSTLVNGTLYPILARKFYHSRKKPFKYDGISGLQYIDKVIDIDQSPIGRTPRSNPATYTGLFTPIRDLFSQLPESKARGYLPGRFSFNVKGGRCEVCHGAGIIKIEMHFLPDVYVKCDTCNGKRYNRETLEVKFKGKSISDILDMTVNESRKFLSNIPVIKRKLDTLYDVGLGYIHLGQQATTLSGGEAQRVKLSTELSKVGTGKTLYILDEPTTGLHFEDIKMLLSVLRKLVKKGNTVIIIEHNMDIIKTADYIIDLGPEGGDKGGQVVATGSPEIIAVHQDSHTAKFLKKELGFEKEVQNR